MKRILLTLLCLPLLTLSQCVLGDCENGYGVFEETNGDIYSGEWKKGLKDGYGYLEVFKGGYYFGEFKNNNLEGFGYFVFPDGNVYFGEMLENEKSGYGAYEYPGNIGFYRGEFLNDKRHGIGLYTDASNEKTRYHMGEWFNDEPLKKAKKGKKKLVVGCLAGNCRKGLGLYISDRVVLGSWVKGKLNGKGLLTVGSDAGIGYDMVNGSFYGKSLYLWGSSGHYYLGEMKDGSLMYGKILERRIDGEIFIGESKDNSINNGLGLSIIQNKNKPNEYFIGTWKNGKAVEVESYIFK
jgi:hypothetical protein